MGAADQISPGNYWQAAEAVGNASKCAGLSRDRSDLQYPRMVAANLNLDILAHVCQFLTPNVSDISSFSLTCSSIRPVAIRQMLRTCRICLNRADEIGLEQFHFFLFADVSARAPHVRTLSIVRSPWTSPCITVGRSDINHVSLIVDILTACPYVETFSLDLDDGPTADDANRTIVSAVASMQSLRSLSVRAPRDDALVLLREVQPRLRKLAIDCPPSADWSIIWSPATLEELLPRFAPTLEELGIGMAIVGIKCIYWPSVSNMTQYPGVRSLSINSLVPQPLLADLQQLFPALDGTLRIGELDVPMCEDPSPDIRAADQRAQDTAQNGSWTRVDRVVCSAQMLYTLGLRCSIRLVRLAPCASRALRHAAAALRENPVPRLTLSLLQGGLLQGLDALFSAELAGTLTHLLLQLLYIPRVGAGKLRDRNAGAVARLPWSHFLDRMVAALRPLKALTHLRISIVSVIHHRSDVASAVQSDQFICTVLGSSFDFDGTAAALAAPLPALRYVFVDTSSHFTKLDTGRDGLGPPGRSEDVCAARGWRVAETGREGGPALVKLSERDVAATVRREELVPFDDE